MKPITFFLTFLLLTSNIWAKGTNWGNRQLEKIVQREQILFSNAPNSANTPERAEWERKVRALITDYQNFLATNPESLEGTMLFGKLLRKIGESKLAYAVFTQANTLNPNLAVIKQEIGNCLAEQGEGPLALWALMEAIELSPQTALYHYQLGELIDLYENQLLLNGIGSGPSLERQKLAAFKTAAQLDINNKDFAWRYAQAFQDILLPNPNEALKAWAELDKQAVSRSEKDAIALHQAHWLLELNEKSKAQALLENIQTPSLQATRDQLWRQLYLI